MNYFDIITIVGTPAILYVLYLIFFDDVVYAYRLSKKEKAEELLQKEEKRIVANRLAQIQLSSSDDEEIEFFIIRQATNLNDEMAGKLVARIAQIRTDRELFNEDASLKSKFSTL